MPSTCDKPVSLLSLFPTLLELCGLPAEPSHDGPSLVPLLSDPKSDWPHLAATYLADPGSYSLSGEHWRLIHYANGQEELYDIRSDPYEWTNLADKPNVAETITALRASAPTSFAKKKEPSIASLTALPWQPVTAELAVPPSRPDGNQFDVFFINRTDQTVRLYWRDQHDGRKHYADIAAQQHHRQNTRPGAVWMITTSDDSPLGYFEVGDRSSQAVVPPPEKSEAAQGSKRSEIRE